MAEQPTTRRTWSVATAALRPHRSLLPLAGIILPLGLAVYATTLPWAKARVFGVLGVSRSPEAVLLVVITLLGLIAASAAAALRGHRLRFAAIVHLAAGVIMCFVTYSAYQLVTHAGKRLLGVTLASVRPGPGLTLFAVAAVLVLALGVLEWVVAERRRRRG